MDFISVPLVLFIIFESLYRIIKLYATRRERILYIEKMSEQPPVAPGSMPPACYPPMPYDAVSTSNRFTALRWAMVLVGIGVGMFFGIMIDLAINPSLIQHPYDFIDGLYSVIFTSSMFVFGGLGLVIAYIIESRNIARLTSGKDNKDA